MPPPLKRTRAPRARRVTRDPGPPATGRSYSAATLVRRLAAALGQPRGAAGGARRRYILKLSSWNVLLLPWLLSAVCLDEGLLSLFLPILIYIENPCKRNK